jgi:hypothetical protein
MGTLHLSGRARKPVTEILALAIRSTSPQDYGILQPVALRTNHAVDLAQEAAVGDPELDRDHGNPVL